MRQSLEAVIVRTHALAAVVALNDLSARLVELRVHRGSHPIARPRHVGHLCCRQKTRLRDDLRTWETQSWRSEDGRHHMRMGVGSSRAAMGSRAGGGESRRKRRQETPSRFEKRVIARRMTSLIRKPLPPPQCARHARSSFLSSVCRGCSCSTYSPIYSQP